MSDQLTPKQKHLNFLKLSTKTQHGLGEKTVSSDAEQISYIYPKSNLLSRTLLKCQVKVSFKNETDSTITLTALKSMELYKLANVIRRITLSTNTNVIPINLSGGEMALLNMLKINNDHVKPSSTNKFYSVSLSADTCAAGSTVTMTAKFLLDMQNTLNDENLSGLILLQNETKQLEMKMDFNKASDVFGTTYGTATMSEFKVLPTYEAFTIPPTSDAFPILNVIKKDNVEQREISAGLNQIALTCGNVYRKIVLEFASDFDISNITGQIEFVLGTDTYLYQVDPETLMAWNQAQFGFASPIHGLVFDFTDQGLPNFGNYRDYINTKDITVFWIKFTSDKASKIKIVTEQVTTLSE